MNAKEVSKQVRLSHWAGVMRERNESGNSVRKWCQENGISEKTYYYWQRKLREAACEQRTEVYETRKTSLVPAGFAEVEVRNITKESSMPESPGRLIAEVRGLRLTTDSAYPAEKFAAILRRVIQP